MDASQHWALWRLHESSWGKKTPTHKWPNLNIKAVFCDKATISGYEAWPSAKEKAYVSGVTEGAIGCPATGNFSRKVQAPLR